MHDLEREQDVEHLRRIALARHAQIEQLIAALARKCAVCGRLPLLNG